MTDRARTGDIQNHNLGLYQLSYGHRWKRAIYRRFLDGSSGEELPSNPVHKFTWTPENLIPMMFG